MNFIKKYFGLIAIFFLSTFSILPFFQPGFFPVHDDTQVARVFEMGQALKDGMFPVRWVADLGYGYGYPIFNFYAPLSYYIGGFLNVLGFDALVSTKIMMVLGIILAGVFMYLLTREFWGEIGGIISGLFYLYAPYHAVDIYVRGDVAEFWAYAFIPLAFLGFYKVFKSSQISIDLAQNNSKFKIQNLKLQFKIQNYWKWISIASLGYTGVIVSHNLTAMMITPFLIILILIFSYISYRNKNILNIYFLILAAFFGLMVSAFYWVPAIFEMKYTNVMSQIGGGADFKNHFVCIQQLWNSQWGFGGSTKGCIDGMSFKMGKLHVLLSLVSLMLLFITILKNKLFVRFSGRMIVVVLSFLGLIISIFLTLDLSKPIWEIIPLMSFFQYPWRFLILASFFTSFLAGSAVWFLIPVIARRNDEAIYYIIGLPRFLSVARNDGKRIVVSVFVIFLLIFFNAKLFSPQAMISKTTEYFTNEYALKWRTSKISDEYLPKGFKKPEKREEIVNQKLIVNSGVSGVVETSSRTQSYLFDINVIRKSNFLLKIAPFPAWKAELNNRPLVLNATDRGYTFSLEPGKYSLNVLFKQTIIQVIGNILSISGLAVLIIGIIYLRKLRVK